MAETLEESNLFIKFTLPFKSCDQTKPIAQPCLLAVSFFGVLQSHTLLPVTPKRHYGKITGKLPRFHRLSILPSELFEVYSKILAIFIPQ